MNHHSVNHHRVHQRVLVVDNHDSFVHTLCSYLRELGADVDIVEAEDIQDDTAAAALLAGYAGIMISPGPGHPRDAHGAHRVVHYAVARQLPVLGVCLGHQVIAEYFGAVVEAAPELMHGMTSSILHDGAHLFAGIPSPFVATRYHSLAVREKDCGEELIITARTEGGTIMAITHRTLPIVGVQFHPESVLTVGGYRVLGNWLEGIGLAGAAARGAVLHPSRGSA